MNWEAIGAIAELLGALGVIVSLVYLASQIRQSTRSAQVASNQLILSASGAFNTSVGQSKQVARVFRVGAQEPEALDEDERVQFDFLMFQWFDLAHQLFLQHRQGTLDESQYATLSQGIPGLVSQPGVARRWERRRLAYSSEFAQFVDSQLSQPSDVPPFT